MDNWDRWIAGISSAIALLLVSPKAIAQGTIEAQAVPSHEAMFETLLDVPSTYSAELAFRSERDDSRPTLTSTDTSLFEPTLPSLWWRRDQLPNRWRGTDNAVLRLEGYRLVRDWISFRSQTANSDIVDIQVDPQYWNRLNYYQKYAIVNQFGLTGMSYGYQVRVYSSISLVGLHTCDFSAVPEFAESFRRIEVPIPSLDEVTCSAAVGPFIDYTSPGFEDLFAPP